MAIVYCCWTTGDDSTGDGSYGNPYKTITQASMGLTGGDEVRVSKSAAHTALTGTLTWADNSTSVSTSADLTGELAATDMIGKDADDNMWWEVDSLNSTTITLRGVYSGTSEAVASYKMEFHDCGSPTSAQTVQVVSASGSSTSSRLKISGGWDLSTQTQTGKSFFCTTHLTNRYGYGLYVAAKNFIELSDLYFARFRNFYISSGTGNKITNMGSFSNGLVDNLTFGSGCYSSTFENLWANCQSTSYDAFSFSGRHSQFDNIHVASAGEGLTVSSFGNIFNRVTARCCALDGIDVVGGNRFGEVLSERNNRGISRTLSGEPVLIGKLTSNNDTTVLYANSTGCQIIVGQLIATGHTTLSDQNATGLQHTPGPLVLVQRLGNDANTGRMYYYYGLVEQDATDARSGTCLKATPTNETSAMWISLGKHRVTSVAADIVLSVYAKDDATFNGDVALMALMNGQVVSDFWVEKTMATTYGQHSLTVDTLDLVSGEWLELVARVRGTAGSVFFDDFAAA